MQVDVNNPSNKVLSPHWEYNSSIKIGDYMFPNRLILIPATEFGNKLFKTNLQYMNTGKKKSYESGAEEQVSVKSCYKVGASWIGEDWSLRKSEGNANGLVQSLEEIGWNCVFNEGDCKAWKSHWVSNDDSYVDNVNIAHYVGHCDLNGWYLVNENDCKVESLMPSYVGSNPEFPGDLWGENDLNWLVISGCGPLEDDIISTGGGNCLTRWKGVFDGLHTLLGYGSTTRENEAEGRTFIQYALEGQTIINAWLRQGVEIQPATNPDGPPYGPNTYVSAMWASNATADTYSDHLFGYGTVSSDPCNPLKISCIWVPC
jgi:hypothetical protein